jgi:hypothetical protein
MEGFLAVNHWLQECMNSIHLWAKGSGLDLDNGILFQIQERAASLPPAVLALLFALSFALGNSEFILQFYQ